MRRIALLGMPNTGKSTFFNRLTGANARIGNWPGITVDLLSAKVLLDSNIVEVVDLPGVYDLPGISEDEQIVERFLETASLDLLLIIINTSQIERQLSLVLQLQKFGLPTILLLNMIDEAQHFGIHVHVERLSELLGMPVIPLSAKYGQGYEETRQLISHTIRNIKKQGESLPAQLVTHILDENHYTETKVDTILQAAVEIPKQLPPHVTQHLDSLLLHRWFGLPLFFGIMYLLFQVIFWLGAPIQDAIAWGLVQLRHAGLENLLSPLPSFIQGLILDGIYDGVGTVASFVPIIILFFLCMTFVEDSGYLSRAAFLMDVFMAKLGLDGRSFVMMLMGFGCNVPALMGTRIIGSRGLRLLSMLVIPFSLCSARLQVFIFFIASLFTPTAAPLVLFSLYLLSFVIAFLSAWLFKGNYLSTEPFVLEMPPYRLPTLKQVLLRAWHEVRHFLNRASKFIIAGVVLVWLLTHIPYDVPAASADTWAGIIGQWLAPIFAPLGIDPPLIIALIFGFVAKEIVIGSLAVIYSVEDTALTHVIVQHVNWVQAYSFMLFTLVYTPCLSTLTTLFNESKSVSFSILNVVYPLVLAWLLSFTFYQTVKLLGF